ncbi:nuclear transport factor 2 family protein [Salsipaludibacter albus]|uniref:nuclear transport factor 2 family protein n=1 Tax=Salsipaludibacter albus TaxID=2849650 RepID=UPI001EE3AD0D|nr:nuclear transport factor 2 family protein [Salsipaludibacter albus]MBY5161922.1 nuclear transport factor 2 family protein [Salsipaludibacter albus]
MTATTTDQTTEEVRRFLADLYDTFSTGDAAAWTDRITRAHEPVVIGTDPEEFWDEREHLVATVRAQAASMAASGVQVRAGTPRIDHHGDVAWIADEPTMTLADGRRIRMRLTAVLVREEDGWRHAQVHLSVGHPNEHMLDLALPV